MSDDEIAALSALVQAYLEAYAERMPRRDEGVAPHLWASRPVREEYHAVLGFVSAVPAVKAHYSSETAEEFVDHLLTESLLDPLRVDPEVRDLAALLRHSLTTRLYVPIEGVTSDAAMYDVGRLRLVQADDDAFERLIVAPYAAAVDANPRVDRDFARVLLDQHRAQLSSLRGRVCAEIRTDLDISRTFEFARTVAIEALCDFLQFSAAIFRAHDSKLRIRWASDAGVVFRYAFATSDDPRQHSLRKGELVSVGQPFELSAERIAKIAELKLDRIANLVGRENLTEYEEMLQRAVRWFAKGERDEHLDDRKLSYVTAVDLFFSEEGIGATKRISRGFAIALASEDAFVPGIARYMYRMFASRSATSHAGELGVIHEDDLTSLRWRTLQFIAAMSAHNFTTKADVTAWVASRVAALDADVLQDLHDATNRKMADAELYLSAVVAVLRRLSHSVLHGEALAKAMTLTSTLANAGRSGGKWMRDLQPLLTKLDAAHDLVVEQIESETVTAAYGVAYVDAVIKSLRKLKWIREALKPRQGSGTR